MLGDGGRLVVATAVIDGPRTRLKLGAPPGRLARTPNAALFSHMPGHLLYRAT